MSTVKAILAVEEFYYHQIATIKTTATYTITHSGR